MPTEFNPSLSDPEVETFLELLGTKFNIVLTTAIGKNNQKLKYVL